MWKTEITLPIDRVDEIKKIVESGKFKEDPTFKYKFEGNFLIIYSKNNDQAYKRGGWFIHNVDSRISYKVYEE